MRPRRSRSRVPMPRATRVLPIGERSQDGARKAPRHRRCPPAPRAHEEPDARGAGRAAFPPPTHRYQITKHAGAALGDERRLEDIGVRHVGARGPERRRQVGPGTRPPVLASRSAAKIVGLSKRGGQRKSSDPSRDTRPGRSGIADDGVLSDRRIACRTLPNLAFARCARNPPLSHPAVALNGIGDPLPSGQDDRARVETWRLHQPTLRPARSSCKRPYQRRDHAAIVTEHVRRRAARRVTG